MLENTQLRVATQELELIPITFAVAKAFIEIYHRHNKPPTGWKFGVGLSLDGNLVGVATAGRPVARKLDDGFTIEINRVCTDGTRNACSMLYGAVWRAAKALGYRKAVTYTQASESGSSLKAAGWKKAKELSPRMSWSESSVKLRHTRDEFGNGNVARVRWEKEVK
jgi:hypothetical protein